MYARPVLQKFGTFRELTQLGNDGLSDGATFNGVPTSDGCLTGGVPDRCPTATAS